MQKYTKIFALILSVMMLGSMLSANAASILSDNEIGSIINTVTDQALVTSPFTAVANMVTNSVVGVNNYSKTTSYNNYYDFGFGFNFGYGNPYQPQTQEVLTATGSGVIITNYGHVLTNYHVIEGSTRVTITTAVDEEELEAKVVGYDEELDIAILQVDALTLPAVQLGDSDQLQVGEWAIVIGNPLGEKFARTMTVGVVSALDREVVDTSTDKYGRRTSITNTMIQVDAAINSGNSGGGMFNTLGQLQGIPARKYSNSSSGLIISSEPSIENIGMCIPINVAKPLIAQVLSEYQGKVSEEAPAAEAASKTDTSMIGRPRLGITGSTISNVNNSMLPNGVLVKEVEKSSPAEQGGIQAGDIIVEANDQIIASMTALQSLLQTMAEGDSINLTVYRDADLAAQINEAYIDLTNVADGEYIKLTVVLRVIDDVNI